MQHFFEGWFEGWKMSEFLFQLFHQEDAGESREELDYFNMVQLLRYPYRHVKAVAFAVNGVGFVDMSFYYRYAIFAD